MTATFRNLNALDFSYLMRQSHTFENLDTLHLVTNGEPLSFMGMASTLFAQKHTGIVLELEGKPLVVARAVQWQDEDFAQLQFINAIEPAESNNVAVLEALLKEIGAWGLTRVMGDISTDSIYLSDFRKANFIVWASHRSYSLSAPVLGAPESSAWRTWTAKDYANMKTLYQSLVPSRIRQYEPMTRSKVLGKVISDASGNLTGYVDLDYGSKGLWAQLFLLPEASRPEVLEDLAGKLYMEFGRPITFSARSYMPWLRLALDKLDAQASGERALIVRHLAIKDAKPEQAGETIFEKSPAEGSIFSAESQN